MGPERYDDLLSALERAGCHLDRADALRRAREGAVIVAEKGGYRIAVFVPSIPCDAESERRIQRIEEGGRSIPLLSAETLAVYKLLFFRSKDLVDLEALVATWRSLDAGWVRAQLVSMLGEGSDRVEKWDEIVRLHRPR